MHIKPVSSSHGDNHVTGRHWENPRLDPVADRNRIQEHTDQRQKNIPFPAINYKHQASPTRSGHWLKNTLVISESQSGLTEMYNY